MKGVTAMRRGRYAKQLQELARHRSLSEVVFGGFVPAPPPRQVPSDDMQNLTQDAKRLVAWGPR